MASHCAGSSWVPGYRTLEMTDITARIVARLAHFRALSHDHRFFLHCSGGICVAFRFSWVTTITNFSHMAAKPQGLYNMTPMIVLSIAIVFNHGIIDTNGT